MGISFLRLSLLIKLFLFIPKGGGLGVILEGAVRKKHLTISQSRTDSVKDSTDGQDQHLVPVDVSGISFQRLSSFRRSLIHVSTQYIFLFLQLFFYFFSFPSLT